MKKILLIAMAMAIMGACAGTQEKPIEIRDDMPMKLAYRRMWEYSAYGESEDPAFIQTVLETIKQLQIGKETQMAADDYTDVIDFIYADGSRKRYEFEAEWIVMDDGKRYEVIGSLSALRRLLDTLVEE